jgi:hypothetical protein
MARCVGLDLGAVDRDRAELNQAALPGQFHHLHEQVRQFLEVKGAEVAQRPVRRIVARRQDPERDILMQLPGQLLRPALFEDRRGVFVSRTTRTNF